MIDLNHILLFIGFVSPVIVLARTGRGATRDRSWRAAALAVFLITALAFALAPDAAGFVGGSAWLILLFLPAIGSRKIIELALQERFANARLLAGLVRILHPSAAMRTEYSLLTALELAETGQSPLAMLEEIARQDNSPARFARAESFRLRGDWEGLLAWCRGNIPLVGLGEDPALLLFYFRALGELGLRDELVLQFAGRAPLLAGSFLHQPIFLASFILVLAFCGRTTELNRLLGARRCRLSPERKEFWRATSELSAGRVQLLELRRLTSDSILRAEIDQRLSVPHFIPPLSPPNESTLRRLERTLTGKRSPLLLSRSHATPAVSFLIGLNLLAFIVEILAGGASNVFALHRLGALEPTLVFAAGQYWRIVTALFLHYGALHLAVNAYALYVLGPPLEDSIGGVKFLIGYLAAGIGSSIGVVLLWRLGFTQADLLVGASGAVMGVVGIWAGLFLHHRHLPMARRRLLNIAIIVGIQTVFDFSTPQVSMAAHLSGFVSGVLIGLIIAPRQND